MGEIDPIKISLPIKNTFSDEDIKNKTDALQDFYINIYRVLNYTFETIVFLEVSNLDNTFALK